MGTGVVEWSKALNLTQAGDFCQTRVTWVRFPLGAPNLGLSRSDEQKGRSQQSKDGRMQGLITRGA